MPKTADKTKKQVKAAGKKAPVAAQPIARASMATKKNTKEEKQMPKINTKTAAKKE